MARNSLVNDRTIRVWIATYKEIKEIAKIEGRSIRVIIERAIKLYKQKGGENAGDHARP